MFTHLMVITGLALGVTACASGGGGQQSGAQSAAYPPDSFSHRVATSEVVLYWNCSRPESGVLRLAGWLRIRGRRSRFGFWGLT